MLTPLRTRITALHPRTSWTGFYLQEFFVVASAIAVGGGYILLAYHFPTLLPHEEYQFTPLITPLTLAPHLLLAILAFLLTTAPRHPLLIRLLNAALFLHPIGEYLAIPVMLVTLWYGFFVPRPTSCPKTRNPAVYFAYHPFLFFILVHYLYSAIFAGSMFLDTEYQVSSALFFAFVTFPALFSLFFFIAALASSNGRIFFATVSLLIVHYPMYWIFSAVITPWALTIAGGGAFFLALLLWALAFLGLLPPSALLVP